VYFGGGCGEEGGSAPWSRKETETKVILIKEGENRRLPFASKRTDSSREEERPPPSKGGGVEGKFTYGRSFPFPFRGKKGGRRGLKFKR